MKIFFTFWKHKHQFKKLRVLFDLFWLNFGSKIIIYDSGIILGIKFGTVLCQTYPTLYSWVHPLGWQWRCLWQLQVACSEHSITEKGGKPRETLRTGLTQCKNLLIYSIVFSSLYSLFHVGAILLFLLLCLFYVIREFHRFSHRGRALVKPYLPTTPHHSPTDLNQLTCCGIKEIHVASDFALYFFFLQMS